jgi:hypothetical protein
MSDDTSIIRFPRNFKAWHEGYAAGRRGVTAEANLYPVATAEGKAWRLGWGIGRTKPLRSVPADC